MLKFRVGGGYVNFFRIFGVLWLKVWFIIWMKLF